MLTSVSVSSDPIFKDVSIWILDNKEPDKYSSSEVKPRTGPIDQKIPNVLG